MRADIRSELLRGMVWYALVDGQVPQDGQGGLMGGLAGEGGDVLLVTG